MTRWQVAYTDAWWANELVTSLPDAIARVWEWTSQRRAEEAELCADLIASKANLLLVDQGGVDGPVSPAADVLDALRTGLAILAQRDGGVHFAGVQWQAPWPGPVAAPLPGMWRFPRPASASEARGVVFTPRELADDVVTNALGPLVFVDSTPRQDIASLRVADIACGSGALLLAAARFLADALLAAWEDDADAATDALHQYETDDITTAARAHVITTCLYGVDIDPLAVELCSIALQLLAPSFQPEGGRLAGLRVGDALVGCPHPRFPPVAAFPASTVPFHWAHAFPEVFGDADDPMTGFDAIVANPPFLGGQYVTRELGEPYRDYLVAALAGGRRARVDLSVYFWIRAHQIVRPYGVVAMIGPHSLLRGANARVAAEVIRGRGWRPYREVRRLKWPTSSAALSCCVVWTHHRADPHEPYRTVPDDRTLGTYFRTVVINGSSVDLYRFTPSA